jgi:hypothetical protein
MPGMMRIELEGLRYETELSLMIVEAVERVLDYELEVHVGCLDSSGPDSTIKVAIIYMPANSQEEFTFSEKDIFDAIKDAYLPWCVSKNERPRELVLIE